MVIEQKFNRFLMRIGKKLFFIVFFSLTASSAFLSLSSSIASNEANWAYEESRRNGDDVYLVKSDQMSSPVAFSDNEIAMVRNENPALSFYRGFRTEQWDFGSILLGSATYFHYEIEDFSSFGFAFGNAPKSVEEYAISLPLALAWLARIEGSVTFRKPADLIGSTAFVTAHFSDGTRPIALSGIFEEKAPFNRSICHPAPFLEKSRDYIHGAERTVTYLGVELSGKREDDLSFFQRRAFSMKRYNEGDTLIFAKIETKESGYSTYQVSVLYLRSVWVFSLSFLAFLFLLLLSFKRGKIDRQTGPAIGLGVGFASLSGSAIMAICLPFIDGDKLHLLAPDWGVFVPLALTLGSFALLYFWTIGRFPRKSNPLSLALRR